MVASVVGVGPWPVAGEAQLDGAGGAHQPGGHGHESSSERFGGRVGPSSPRRRAKVEQFEQGVVGGEVAAVAGDLARLEVQRLDQVRRVQDPVDLRAGSV
jgi:hypothetical protein